MVAFPIPIPNINVAGFPLALLAIVAVAVGLMLLLAIILFKKRVETGLRFLIIDPEDRSITVEIGEQIVPGIYKAGDYIGIVPEGAPRYRSSLSKTGYIVPVVSISKTLYMLRPDIDTLLSYIAADQETRMTDIVELLAWLATSDQVAVNVRLSPSTRLAIYIDPAKLSLLKMQEEAIDAKRSIYSLLNLAMGKESFEKMIEKMLELSRYKLRETATKWSIVIIAALIASVVAALIFLAK